jgi:hypothetical protein
VAEDEYLAYEELPRSVQRGERARDDALRLPLPAPFADWTARTYSPTTWRCFWISVRVRAFLRAQRQRRISPTTGRVGTFSMDAVIPHCPEPCGGPPRRSPPLRALPRLNSNILSGSPRCHPPCTALPGNLLSVCSQPAASGLDVVKCPAHHSPALLGVRASADGDSEYMEDLDA